MVGEHADDDRLMRLDTMTVEVNRARALGDVPHGFLGRRGGVSTGLYAGLNVGTGSDDDPAIIAENRRLAVEAVLPGAILLQPVSSPFGRLRHGDRDHGTKPCARMPTRW